MGIIVGVDTGGTFTDGLFAEGGRVEQVKVDTTPHDLTVCFMECLRAGAAELGYESFREFLRQVQVIRFSSTTATNVLVERKGSKTGLLISASDREGLGGGYVDPALVREVTADRLTEDGLVEVVKDMLDLGARIFVVSFSGAHEDRTAEKHARELFRRVYPKHYLGSVPVILSGDFCNHPDERGRTNLAVLDAYVHSSVSRVLYKAEDNLRAEGYARPLLIAHSNGGCSRVAKTRAIDTVGSSPVAGYIASQHWAERYGMPNVVTIDVGGTSFDVGLIVDGQTSWKDKMLFDVPIATPVVGIYSFGLGGGSIVRGDGQSGALTVGPESAGAVPGPACYGLGGGLPTVTDAEVILHRINPDYFLGGRRQLDLTAAEEAMRRHVAAPLGIEVEPAALRVVAQAADQASKELDRLIRATGKDPAEFVLFSLGGAGGAKACEIAERLGINVVLTFPWSSVSGAYGASLMDVVHVYMTTCLMPLTRNGEQTLDLAAFEARLEIERQRGLRDMAGEGLAADEVAWQLDIEVLDEDSGVTHLIPIPSGNLAARSDIDALTQAVGDASNLTLWVAYVKACWSLDGSNGRSAVDLDDPQAALKGSRRVVGDGWPQATSVYDLNSLGSGLELPGPAVLERVDTTIVVPPGWGFTVDTYGNTKIIRT